MDQPAEPGGTERCGATLNSDTRCLKIIDTFRRAKLDLIDADEGAKVFYRELSEADFKKIAQIINRLLAWSQWGSPINSEIDSRISGSKGVLKDWFRSKGLTASFLLGINE